VRRNAGEPLSNQDLVGWVQVGVQHVPRAEDIPIGALVCINVALTEEFATPLQTLMSEARLVVKAYNLFCGLHKVTMLQFGSQAVGWQPCLDTLQL